MPSPLRHVFSSFSKAAAELGVTTSAISYTIKRMETGLDVVLFVRNTRSIELTESGFYFYRKATDLLNDFHAIKRGIDTISQGIEARVRICINQLLYTPRHTARLLQVLKKQFPTCQITVTTEVYNGVWDSIINNQANIAIGAPDTLLDGGGIDYTEIGAIRWVFAIAPEHPLAFVPEPIAESQLRLYPNIMVEDTAHTINKKVGWLLHGQEAILVPDFNTKCQCQILGEGIGFLPEYMAPRGGRRRATGHPTHQQSASGFPHAACHTTCGDRPGHSLDQTTVWSSGRADEHL